MPDQHTPLEQLWLLKPGERHNAAHADHFAQLCKPEVTGSIPVRSTCEGAGNSAFFYGLREVPPARVVPLETVWKRFAALKRSGAEIVVPAQASRQLEQAQSQWVTVSRRATGWFELRTPCERRSRALRAGRIELARPIY